MNLILEFDDIEKTAILKHCNKIGLKATRKTINKILDMPEVQILITSANEMNKLYQMCKKGFYRYIFLLISTNFEENDIMIETLIKIMKLKTVSCAFKILHFVYVCLIQYHIFSNNIAITKNI